jgi:hypothetical protein
MSAPRYFAELHEGYGWEIRDTLGGDPFAQTCVVFLNKRAAVAAIRRLAQPAHEQQPEHRPAA